MNSIIRPRRTMLYVPAHIEKHLEKARKLDADSIIFDCQESVPPAQKANARQSLRVAFKTKDFGHSEKVLRINPLSSKWGHEDLELIRELQFDAVLLPRVESESELLNAIDAIDAAGGAEMDIMINIESPLGVLRAESIIGASDRVVCVILGTTDLANELRLNQTQNRLGLLTSLSMVILAARAHKRAVIDGPHFDLKNVEACEYACRQARDLGFDGKTVIHPVQLEYTNDAFTPKQLDIKKARAIIDAIEAAEEQGKSTAVVDNRLVEPVMREWAERVLSHYDRVQELGQSELLGPPVK